MGELIKRVNQIKMAYHANALLRAAQRAGYNIETGISREPSEGGPFLVAGVDVDIYSTSEPQKIQIRNTLQGWTLKARRLPGIHTSF